MPGDSADDSQAKRVAFAAACDVVQRTCRRLARMAEENAKRRSRWCDEYFAACEVDASWSPPANVRVTVRICHGPKVYERWDTHHPELSEAFAAMARELA